MVLIVDNFFLARAIFHHITGSVLLDEAHAGRREEPLRSQRTFFTDRNLSFVV